MRRGVSPLLQPPVGFIYRPKQAVEMRRFLDGPQSLE
jgi:hypothetical protein